MTSMASQVGTEEQWVLEPALRPYLRLAALICVFCFLIGVILNSIPFNQGSIPLALGVVGGLLGVLFAASALFLWLSMLSYWWNVIRKEQGPSWGWPVALVLGNWVAAVVFYFLVFRPFAERQTDASSL